MKILRNQFLNTASFLSGPNDKPGEAGAVGDDQTGAAADGGAEGAGDDTGVEGAEGAGDDGAGDNTGDDDGADADDDDGADPDGDEDDEDLAGLTPEQKKKVQARIERETRWRDRQIDKLHAKRRSAETEAEAAAAIVGKRKPAAEPGENLTAEQIEARARELAGQISSQEKYDADANAAHAAGVKAYGDKWSKALAKLPKLGGVEINDMLDIMKADHPATVLYSLSDPDTYERVMGLPPAKRLTEFIKMGLKEPPKRKTEATAESKRPGDQPAPIAQVRGGRQVAAQTVNIYDDKLPDDAWYAARNASRRKKFSQVD